VYSDVCLWLKVGEWLLCTLMCVCGTGCENVYSLQ